MNFEDPTDLQKASEYDIFTAIQTKMISMEQFYYWLELQRQESYDDGVSDSYMYDGDADDD
jgi:hypothetical protein